MNNTTTRKRPFECCFKNTASDVSNIYHPFIVIEWKANTEKASYKHKHNFVVYIPSIKRKLDRSMNVYHRKNGHLMEQEGFHAKGDNIIFNAILE